MDKPEEVNKRYVPSLEVYRAALRGFDAAVCDALAVGQAISGRMASHRIGFGTHISTRITGHAQAMVRAAPLSRWARSDFNSWDFCALAGHARAIIEGLLLFHYLTDEPESDEEWSARINVMNLNDCTRRIQVLGGFGLTEEVAGLEVQAEELREKLKANAWFVSLKEPLRKKLLTGNWPTIQSRDEQLEKLGWDREQFYSMWNMLSQYTHVLPFSIYRTEPDGRGTGLLNDTDLSYCYMVLVVCTGFMTELTDKLIEWFPDAAPARQGLASKFSPGPKKNLPNRRRWRLLPF